MALQAYTGAHDDEGSAPAFTMPNNMIPIIEVSFEAYGKGMWWSMPQQMSAEIYNKHMSGENAAYTWDSGDSSQGSGQPDADHTFLNRYILDFEAMEQMNMDTNRKRSVRIAWMQLPLPSPSDLESTTEVQ